LAAGAKSRFRSYGRARFCGHVSQRKEVTRVIRWKHHYVRAMLVVGAIAAYAVAAGAGFRWY
jgi:hypothetical protein